MLARRAKRRHAQGRERRGTARTTPAQSPLEEKFAADLRLRGFPAWEFDKPYGLRDLTGKERLWRFDFGWRAARVAVEIQGGVWRGGGGAHSHPSNIERDALKFSLASVAGWTVILASDKMLRDGTAARLTQRALVERAAWGPSAETEPRGTEPSHPEDQVASEPARPAGPESPT